LIFMDKYLSELEGVLVQMVGAHERMLWLLQRKRAALRKADRALLASYCAEENQWVQEIGELEKRRIGLVGELTLLMDPGAAAPLRLLELGEGLAEPWRGKVLVLRVRLKERMDEVRRESAVARLAVESLVRHMSGVVQMVGGSMTGVGVYGRGGVASRAALAVSTFSATV
jgi:hypothetical protein